MAKELPYFKFEPNQWENGNIQICSREDKGLFMDLCSMYWSRLGDVPLKLAIQKLCAGNATAFDSLRDENIIAIIDGHISIEFLNEQLSEFENTSKQNSENALKGWAKRRKNKGKSEKDATALNPQCESDAIKEEKIREEETNTKKSVSEIEVDLSGGDGEFKDQLLKDLKETKYSESDFLDNWTTCRKHFLKTETHIKSLNFHERTEFERVKKTYSKEEINAAMQTLFKQERIPFEAMVLRPKHFLEKFDTYYSAGKSTKIYATKQKQTEY